MGNHCSPLERKEVKIIVLGNIWRNKQFRKAVKTEIIVNYPRCKAIF